MNPALIIALLDKAPAVLEFAAKCIEEGAPIVQTMIEVGKASDDPTAKAGLARLRAAYEASDVAADEALARLFASTP